MSPETLFFIFTQAIGFAGMGLGIASYQAKTRNGILFVQMSASVMWCTHFALLLSPTGLCHNGIAILRNLLFSQKEKHAWARSLFLPIAIGALFLGAGIYTFTLEGPISLLPTAAMLLSTVALYITNEKAIRILSLFVSPLWLIYNVTATSVAGVICESLTILSILLALFRFRQKKEKNA